MTSHLLSITEDQYALACKICTEYTHLTKTSGVLSIFPNSIHLTEQAFSDLTENSTVQILNKELSSILGNLTKRFFQLGNIEIFCLVERKEETNES